MLPAGAGLPAGVLDPQANQSIWLDRCHMEFHLSQGKVTRRRPLWAYLGGHGPSSLSLAGKAIWGRGLHWAVCPGGGWPTVSQRQEEGEPEFPGVARASLCNGSRRCRDKPRVTQ